MPTFRIIALVGCSMLFSASILLAQEPLTYFVELNAQKKLFHVTMQIPAEPGLLKLAMPLTTPGSASIENNARYVLHFQASDLQKKPLSSRRFDKQTWEVEVPAAETISIQYDVQPNTDDKLRLASNSIQDTGGFLNGGSIFLYSPAHLESSVSLRLKLPAGWRIATPLNTDANGSFVAANYRKIGRYLRLNVRAGWSVLKERQR